MPDHIVLAGPMGAGKSTLGPVIAARFGLPFVDLDDAIEQEAGCSIPELFDGPGEAHFRALEQSVLRRVLAGPRSVVALGGGALLADGARAAVEAAGGKIIVFTAPWAVLAQRIERSDRPLGPEAEALFIERAAHYAALGPAVRTDRDSCEIIDHVIDLAQEDR